MAKEIESLHITPAKNGGYTVRHHYRRQVRKNSKAPSGIDYEYPEGEEHVFGPDDSHKVLTHVSKALGMGKGKSNEEE